MAVQSRRELGDQIAELSQSIGVDVPIDEAVRQGMPPTDVDRMNGD